MKELTRAQQDFELNRQASQKESSDLPTIRQLAENETIEYKELGIKGISIGGSGVQVAVYPSGKEMLIMPPKKIRKMIATIAFAHLVTCEGEITGPEMKFMRYFMDLTQEQLGEKLGLRRETVIKHEQSSEGVPPQYALALQRLGMKSMLTSINALPEDVLKRNDGALSDLNMLFNEKFSHEPIHIANDVEVLVTC